MFQHKKRKFVSPSNHVMFCINTNEMSNNFISAFVAAKGKHSTFTLKLDWFVSKQYVWAPCD